MESQVSVKAVAQNVTVTFEMHKDDLETLKGILNLAESKLEDLKGLEKFVKNYDNALSSMEKTGDLISMIRGAILRY